MEQKHKTSSSKYFDSTSKIQEKSTMSTTNNKLLCENTMEEEQRKTNMAPNQKTKGFRGIFKLFPFSSGGKSKSQSSKSPNEQIDASLDIDDIRQLIVLYSKYDNLYNTKNPQYGNKQIDNIYYSDMARSFPNKTGPQIQAMLMDLRATFEEEYAIIENARSLYGEIRLPSIKYFNEFLFLVPFLNMSSKSATKCKSNAGNRRGQNLYNQRGMPKRKQRKDTNEGDEQIMSNQEHWQLQQQYSAPRQESTLCRCDEQMANDQPCLENYNTSRNHMQSELSPPDSSNLNASNQSTAVEICCAEPTAEQCHNECAKLAQNNCNTLFSELTQTQNNEDPAECSNKEICAVQCTRNATRKSQESERLEYSDRRQITPRNGQEQHACPAKTQESAKGNAQQLQMLCDMIRAELSSAPDFIYFDAKWRIIEILREVNKRQMIYKKGDPRQVGARNSDDTNDHCNHTPTRCTNSHKLCNNCTFCTTRAGR